MYVHVRIQVDRVKDAKLIRESIIIFSLAFTIRIL